MKEFIFVLSALVLLGLPLPIAGRDCLSRTIIIKADDVRRETSKWNRFFAISREKGVKVSAGIICTSLVDVSGDYMDWLRKLAASGEVEFWNHGWDHNQWENEDGRRLREFSGTGYEHQKKQFADAQAAMKRVLGSAPIAFGAPYNAIDSDTIRVLNEDPDLRLLFGYPGKGKGLGNIFLAPMVFRGEHDGTGKPNFSKFKEEYMQKKGATFSAIQFHPNNFSEEHFAEYALILDFLISEGWTFILPAEYPAR